MQVVCRFKNAVKDIITMFCFMIVEVLAAREKNGIYLPRDRFLQEEAEKKVNMVHLKVATWYSYAPNVSFKRKKENSCHSLPHCLGKRKGYQGKPWIIIGA